MKGFRRTICSILILAIISVLAACTGTNPNENASSSKPSEQQVSSVVSDDKKSLVKVMSYNIYYLDIEPRAENIVKFIKMYPSDVIGLQEVTADWRPHINKAFADKYNIYGYSRSGADWADESQRSSGWEYSIILYSKDKYELIDKGHFWISTTPNIFSAQIPGGIVSQTPRCINWVMLKDKETGGEFVFLNAHLDAYNESVKKFSTELITEQVKQFSEGLPVIMVGDWNLQISSPAIQYFISNGYENVRHTAEETTDIGTFHSFEQLEKDAWKFGDIILASKDRFRVKKFDIKTDKFDGKYISDHHMLVAEMYY